jgi:molybdopterin molybdotransferase
MPEFLRLITPEKALKQFLEAIPPERSPGTEKIPASHALGRVLSDPVTATDPSPPFARSTVDGYALRAADTYGASPSLPAYLKLMGEVAMGSEAIESIQPTQALSIHTGGMIPPGADAVVMIENTELVGTSEIEVYKPVAQGENILQKGEDVQEGEVVLPAGQVIRAQDMGGLMALGKTEVMVSKKPRVGILSTGDEIIPPDAAPKPGQIRDINSYTLSALVSKAGGIPLRRGIIPDRYEDLLEAAQEAHAEDDIVVITAGSSVSVHDQTANVIGELGKPGVLVHGVSIRPGKPTILALAGDVPFIGLPGNPVSALVVAGLFVVPILRRLLGIKGGEIQPQIQAKLTTNVASETGREDYLPVRLLHEEDGWFAEPVFGRSNLIFTLVRADGLVQIPPEATGLPKGAEVTVLLF